MIRRPPRSTRTDTLFPYTTLFRSYGFTQGAGLRGGYVAEEPLAVSFEVTCRGSGETFTTRLKVPGRHNALNAIAALAAHSMVGVPLPDAAVALDSFTGLKRRFEVAGTAGDGPGRDGYETGRG